MQPLKFFAIAALTASAAAQGPPLPDCDGLANSGYAVRDHVRSIANDGWAGNVRTLHLSSFCSCLTLSRLVTP